VWKKSIFWDVHRQLNLTSMEVNRIQHLIDEYGIDDDLHAQELQAQLLLTKAYKCQDQFLREKPRHQWFIHGYRNSAYFHRLAKIKSSFQPIFMLMMGEVRLTEPRDIENHVLEYFQEIFRVDNSSIPNDLVNKVIPSLVTDQDNLMMNVAPGVDQIKRVVFDLNGDGAPRPDGFGGHFFQFF